MRRGEKPAKPGGGARPAVARTSRKSEGATVRDLEKRLAQARTREAEALGREAEALEQQAATAEVLKIISASPADLETVFRTLLVNAARLCGAHHGGIFKFEAGALRLVAAHNITPEFRAHLESAPIRPGPGGSLRRAALELRPVQNPDSSADPDLPAAAREAYRREGMRTGIAVPLLKENTLIGAIAFHRREVRPFLDEQIALLKTFADQAAIAIENLRLLTELQEKNRALTVAHAQVTEALEQQTASSEILRVISSSPTDVRPVFDAVTTSAARLCEAQYAGVMLVRDGHLVIPQLDDYGLPEEQQEVLRRLDRIPISADMAVGRAVIEGTVQHVEDVLAGVPAPDEVVAQIRHALGFRTFLAVPMLREGAAIGVIVAWRTEPRPFSAAQIELVKTFGAQAVIAIENVRLFKELEEKNRALTEAHAQATEALEQQTATAEILRVISSSPTDVQPVFDTIAQNVLRLCNGLTAGVFRFDGQLVHLAAVHNFEPEARKVLERAYPMPPNRENLSARAILDRVTVHVPDLEGDPNASSSRRLGRATGYRSVLAVPMLRDGLPIGVISVGRAHVGPFSDRQIELIKTFADQAVIAIENVRLFNETKEALEQQRASGEILGVISSSPTDVQPVFDVIVQSAVRLCGGLHSNVYRVEDGLIHLVAHHNFSPAALEHLQRRFPRPVSPGEGLAVRVIREGILVHLRDAQTDPEVPETTRRTTQALGARSVLYVPMLRDRVGIGVIVVSRGEVKPFSDKEIALIRTFADQAVIAIENVRLFKELQARNQELTVALARQTATSEVLAVISGAQTDVQPVFEAIVQNARRLCDASYSSVYRLDGQLVHLIAHNHQTPEAAEVIRRAWPMPLTGDSFVVRAIRENTIVHADSQDDRAASAALIARARALAHRRALVVPMVREGQPIGAIRVSRGEATPFTEQHIALLKTFADQAVIAIENVRLFKELEARTADLTRSVEQLTALGEVGRAVSSTLDLETVLTTIVSRAVQLSGLDGGVVFEYDDGAEEFVQRVATETGGALAEARRATRIRKGEGALGRTAITLEPVQVPDITVPGAYESRLRDNLIESGIRAILAVPMIREGRLIGCLGVTRNRPGEFPAATIELLRTFASQSALAIQNARLFREIEDKSRQLEVASQHKSEFLANMSHELRTPLNAIIGFSEVLTERMFGDLNEKQEEYLKDIHASGQHLLSLINDILDLSKIEAGRMELEPTDFDLPAAIDNALTLVRERAGRRGITLGREIDDRVDTIRGDERKVKQVLLNLLSNALKFTPEGGRVDVRTTVNEGLVDVSVTDTGLGIAPEDQEAVFEEFRQVGTADKKVEGTGLGLALSRKFIELHGGRIWVESQVGQGSTFTFTIPVRRDG